jgi:hypothetical protein
MQAAVEVVGTLRGDALQAYVGLVMVPWVASDTSFATSVWCSAFDAAPAGDAGLRRSTILFEAMRRLPRGDEDGLIYEADGDGLPIIVESLTEFYREVLWERPSVPHDLQAAFAAQKVAIDIAPLLPAIGASDEAACAVYLHVSAGHALPRDGPEDWLSQLYTLRCKETFAHLGGPGRTGALRFLAAVAGAHRSVRMEIADATLPGFGELQMRSPEAMLIRAVFRNRGVVQKYWAAVAGMKDVPDDIRRTINKCHRGGVLGVAEAYGKGLAAGLAAGRKHGICGAWECPVCCEVTENQTACIECGHRICATCDEKVDESGAPLLQGCPFCRSETKRVKLR